MITIGLFGPAEDAEVQALQQRLEHRGAAVWVVDLGQIPAHLPLAIRSDEILVDGRSLLDMDAAFLRRVSTALPDHAGYDADPPAWDHDQWRAARPDTVRALAAERAGLALRNGLVALLAKKRPVINPPLLQNLHRLKTHLLWRLQEAGLPVPPFACGSAAAALADFAHQAKEQWAGAVDKPLAGIWKTHLVTEERHENHRWETRPAFYQRFIPGDTLRCYVLAGRLLSCARIVHGGTTDSSVSQTGIEVVALPDAARALAEQVAHTLDLDFCGMDLMHEPGTQEYWVVDCNLSPMFVSYGKLSRCDIAGHLADRLIERARGEHQPPRVQSLVDEAKDILASDPEIARLLKPRS